MMPAGVYYVGDLCYVMSDEEWQDFCKITTEGRDCLDGEFTMPDGRRFATYSTKYGDGEYRDQYGYHYGVDAGLIGCILVDDIRAEKYDNLSSLGSIVKFEKDFNTKGGEEHSRCCWDGVIHIGHVRIETDPIEEYEEQ